MQDEDKALAELAELQEQFENLQTIMASANKSSKKKVDDLRNIAAVADSYEESRRLVRIANNLDDSLEVSEERLEPRNEVSDTVFLRSIDRL